MFSWLKKNKRPKTSDSLLASAPTLTLSELVRRTRILVIDDRKTEFPFPFFEKEGYSITYWKDVEDVTKLESGYFDIIVLDINGVGRKLDPDAEGAGVLRHLKERNPSQIIVAYSGQSHDPAKIQFFTLADQFVPKPTSALTWKEILDNLIREKVSVSHYWSAARRMLKSQGKSDMQIRELEQAILNAEGRGEYNEAAAKDLIVGTLGTANHLATLATVVGKIILLYS